MSRPAGRNGQREAKSDLWNLETVCRGVRGPTLRLSFNEGDSQPALETAELQRDERFFRLSRKVCAAHPTGLGLFPIVRRWICCCVCGWGGGRMTVRREKSAA